MMIKSINLSTDPLKIAYLSGVDEPNSQLLSSQASLLTNINSLVLSRIWVFQVSLKPLSKYTGDCGRIVAPTACSECDIFTTYTD